MSLFSQLTNSATFGFGASAGRSSYKKLEKNFLFFLIITIILLIAAAPGWAGYDMYRGNARRSKPPNRFLLNLIIACAPLATILAAIYYQPEQGTPIITEDQPWFIAGATMYSIVVFYIGRFFGGLSASNSYKKEDVISHNNTFLAEHGFATYEEEELLLDGDGESLREIESNSERITFMALGRRNKRAYIDLSPDGRFKYYSGVVHISEMFDPVEA